QREHPGRVVLVDADADAHNLIARGEPQSAIRAGLGYAPRLTRLPASQAQTAAFGPDGTVLITGASGAIAAVVARHLVDVHGVRSFLLLARSSAGAGAELARELTESGAH